MRTFIEIGANLGTHTPQFIKDDARLFCFEPSQELYFELWKRYKDNPNVMILPFAVDIETGIKKFNVQGKYDWGCSSLHEYNDNLDQKWPNRVSDEFIFTHSYNVLTIRLDDFFKLYKITEVDYMWIDAQGNDFNILKSANDMLSIVKAGCCETAGLCELYQGVDNSFDGVAKHLSSFGFEVNGGPDGYEKNVSFWRKGHEIVI